MQRLNTLWQVVSAVSTVKDIAQHSKTYHFAVSGPVTFYLRAENAEVRVTRWNRQEIEFTVRLQAAFGWRVVTDQDDAGVYVVAKRRAVVGGLSWATFEVFIPHDAYLILKLDDGRIILDHVSGTLEVPPYTGNDNT
jgi:hypothetical protein